MTPVHVPAILELGGIPAHPLVVHAVVILVPLLAVLALLLMLLRADIRRTWSLPLAAVSLVLLGITQLALTTGEQLAEATGEENEADIEEHEEHAETMRIVLAAMTGLLAVTGVVERRQAPVAAASTAGAGAVTESRRSLLSGGLRAATGIAALGVVATTFNTGHSGAWAVWKETAAEIKAGGGESGEGGEEGEE